MLSLCFSWNFGQNAVNFDGNSDFIQTDAPGITGTSNRTFEAWIYMSSSAPLSNLCILDYGVNAVGSRNTFAVNGNRAITFISGGTNANITSTSNVVPADTWTHVAFVLNAGTGFLYANGSQVGTGNLSSVNTPPGNQNVIVGQRISGGSIPFYGSIDEVRIWDVARSATEIQNNMNNEVCNGSSNLQLYMQMNQGLAGGNNAGLTNVIDFSGNGYSGTMSGFALTGSTSNWVSGATLTAGMNGSFASAEECDSYTWSANNQTYTSSGTYSHTLVNGAGCDSIATLDLTINTANDITTTRAECDSFTWNVTGLTYYASTTESEDLTNSFGCSYTHTLNLTINNSTSSSETVESCGEYTWDVNGQTYTMTGVYTENMTTSAGCDSIMELDLTVSSVDASAIDNGDSTFTANASGATYQWIDCGNDNTPIAGATSQTYQATQDGSYAVIVTEGNCTDTSECMTVDYLAVGESVLPSPVIYPNPTKGSFDVSFGQAFHGDLHVLDINGKTVFTKSINGKNKTSVNINVEPGVYFVRVQSDKGLASQEKLVKF